MKITTVCISFVLSLGLSTAALSQTALELAIAQKSADDYSLYLAKESLSAVKLKLEYNTRMKNDALAVENKNELAKVQAKVDQLQTSVDARAKQIENLRKGLPADAGTGVSTVSLGDKTTPMPKVPSQSENNSKGKGPVKIK